MIRERIHNPANRFHKELLLFCFMPVIQLELNQSLRIWNSRSIRQSATAPGGVPEILFHFPEKTGFEKQSIPVTHEEIRIVEDIFRIDNPPMTKDEDIFELFFCYMGMCGFQNPQDPESALDLYVNMLGVLENDNFDINTS